MKPTGVCVAVMMASLGAPTAWAQAGTSAEDPTPQITTRGTGQVTLAPDHAQLQLGVEVIDSTASLAASRHADVLRAVIDTLLDMGFARESLPTVGYTVVPHYEFTRDSRHQVGYEASTTVRLTIWELARIGEIIEAALDAGGTTIRFVRFHSSALGAARDSAVAMAVAEARHDAEVLARAAGGTLGPLRELTTEAGSQPLTFRAAERAAFESQRAVVITPQDVVVVVSVVGRWQFLPRQ